MRRTLIAMNGPTTARLNWDIVNRELEEDTLQIIVTNGFLSVERVIDSPNVIYLVNDPLIELLLNAEISDLDDPGTRKFLLEKYHFDDDHINAFKSDLKSCQILRESKNIRVAMRSKSFCRHVFNEDRIIDFDFSFIDKLLIRFSYKWHQDGSPPAAVFNKYGIKTFPFESRIAKNFIKSRMFSKLWYKLNFCQTPNTFYRALDLSIGAGTEEILFIGRNSQIDEWLNEGVYDGISIPISYSYFFSDLKINMKIRNYEAILRELYYSSQYIRMVSEIFNHKKFISLEKSYCYRDFYLDESAKRYTI